MDDIAGRLVALGGIGLSSPDGYTYLNDAARELVKQAAAEVSKVEPLERKVRELESSLKRIKGVVDVTMAGAGID